MKTWMTGSMVVLAVVCLTEQSIAVDQPPTAMGQSNLVAMLKADMPEAKISVSNREFAVVVQWMTQAETQTCQRPLDLYLADSRIGAFIHPILNLTLKGPSLCDLAQVFKQSVVEYLAKKGIPEKHVLAGKDAGGIHMEESAEPQGGRYSPPAARSSKPTP